MTRSIAARAAIALISTAVLSLSFAGVASAREGSSSRSVGKGIKCSTVTVRNADGTVTFTQVCRKGV
jgi:exo-beta-1,3-glucanase (GH17 family)